MKLFLRFLFVLVITLPMLPVVTQAHFILLEPASWVEENQLGAPQKLGPCGGDPAGDNAELLTGAVTEVTGGSELHVKMPETIFHSGHYRIALAVNSRNELPPDPITVEQYTDRGLYSVWGAIQSPPQIPIIANGLFRHYPAEGENASFRPETPMPP
jgi:hypothetical protein